MVTATAFREAYSAGKMTALSYAQACLQEIERSDGQIQAWEHLVPDAVRQMAEQADADPAADNMKPLRGVPVGIKDIIDTCDAPCKWGVAELAGRQPEADAAGRHGDKLRASHHDAKSADFVLFAHRISLG